jgi:hypothetical protein
MSEYEVEPQGQVDPGPSANGEQLARYTVHVPVRDKNQKEIPHILDQLRKALSAAGFPGRTVIRKVQGDWQGDETYYDTEEMDLVLVDAPDSPEVVNAMINAARGVKEASGEEAIYLTVQPITTYLI